MNYVCVCVLAHTSLERERENLMRLHTVAEAEEEGWLKAAEDEEGLGV